MLTYEGFSFVGGLLFIILIMDGWIKLHRKFCKWEWYDKSEMVHLFIHLLLNANHEDKKWRGVIIKRGELATGLSSLKAKTHISIRTLRTCINRLKSTGELTRKVTNKYSILTICNYESYQCQENETDKLIDTLPNKQPTSNRQQTRSIRKKRRKEEIPPPNKSVDFIDQIINCFVEEYGDYKILAKGKERAAAGKILSEYKKEFPEHSSEETLEGLQIFFRQCLSITSDKWLYDNMSLPIIVSQYNKIINIIKNGETTTKQKGATPKQIAGAVAKHFAIDYKKPDERYSEN
jgi:hypothetical protein